MYMKVVNIRF